MKRLLVLIIYALIVQSCSDNTPNMYETVVVIYYPGDIDTITLQTRRPIKAYSVKGTSYVNSYGPPYNEYAVETTAPIKILSTKKLY